MRWSLGFLALCVLAGAACQGKGQNTVDVWTKVETGTIRLTVAVPDDVVNVTSVQYFVDDGAVGNPSSTGPDYAVDFDTTKVGNGVHEVKAVGNPGQGDVVLLRASILIKNAPAGTPAPRAFKRR